MAETASDLRESSSPPVPPEAPRKTEGEVCRPDEIKLSLSVFARQECQYIPRSRRNQKHRYRYARPGR